MNHHWHVTYPLPAGEPCPAGPCAPVGVYGLAATLVRFPTWYLIVGLDPDEADGLEAHLEDARLRLAHDIGLRATATVPKLAVVAAGGALADFRYRTRLAAGGGWHDRVASSGLLALAVAAARSHTVPGQLLAGPASLVRVATPAGVRTIEYITRPNGRPGVRLCLGDVHLESRGGIS